MAVCEGVVNLAQPVLQDLGEANQNRQRDAAQDQRVDQLLQIDERRVLFGMDQNVPRSLIEKYPLPQLAIS